MYFSKYIKMTSVWGWNSKGIPGPQGPRGPKGDPGTPGFPATVETIPALEVLDVIQTSPSTIYQLTYALANVADWVYGVTTDDGGGKNILPNSAGTSNFTYLWDASSLYVQFPATSTALYQKLVLYTQTNIGGTTGVCSFTPYDVQTSTNRPFSYFSDPTLSSVLVRYYIYVGSNNYRLAGGPATYKAWYACIVPGVMLMNLWYCDDENFSNPIPIATPDATTGATLAPFAGVKSLEYTFNVPTTIIPAGKWVCLELRARSGSTTGYIDLYTGGSTYTTVFSAITETAKPFKVAYQQMP